MLGRVALLVLLGAGALAVTVAWGWTALLVYGFCTFAAAAQVAALVVWGRVAHHVGRETAAGRFRLTR